MDFHPRSLNSSILFVNFALAGRICGDYYCNELKASYPTSVMVHIPQPEFTSEEFYEYQEMIEVENCRDEYDEFESYDSYEDYLEDGGFE